MHIKLKNIVTLNLLNNNMNDDYFWEFINCQPKVDSLKKSKWINNNNNKKKYFNYIDTESKW